MKKLLLVLAIGAFAACNDSATSTESSVDSSTTTTVEGQTSGDSAALSGADTTTIIRTDSLKSDSAK